MLKRIITAAVLTAVLLPAVYFSDTWVFPAVVALLAAVAVYEFASCIGQKKPAVYMPLMLAAAASPLLVRAYGSGLPMAAMLLCGFLYIMCMTVVFHGDDGSVTELCAGVLYITGGFSSLVLMRDIMPDRYLLLVIIPVCTDTFAYFVGSFLGRHKLCPQLSPKKTVEGAVGGVIGAVIGTAVFGAVIIIIGGTFSFAFWCTAALPLSVLSMFGDLFASAVKRRHGVKDYGKIFPGHGGVLDRFDSIPPLAMAAYIITVLFVR